MLCDGRSVPARNDDGDRSLARRMPTRAAAATLVYSWPMGRAGPSPTRPNMIRPGPIGMIIYLCRAGPAHVPRPQARARPEGQFGVPGWPD